MSEGETSPFQALAVGTKFGDIQTLDRTVFQLFNSMNLHVNKTKSKIENRQSYQCARVSKCPFRLSAKLLRDENKYEIWQHVPHNCQDAEADRKFSNRTLCIPYKQALEYVKQQCLVEGRHVYLVDPKFVRKVLEDFGLFVEGHSAVKKTKACSELLFYFKEDTGVNEFGGLRNIRNFERFFTEFDLDNKISILADPQTKRYHRCFMIFGPVLRMLRSSAATLQHDILFYRPKKASELPGAIYELVTSDANNQFYTLGLAHFIDAGGSFDICQEFLQCVFDHAPSLADENHSYCADFGVDMLVKASWSQSKLSGHSCSFVQSWIELEQELGNLVVKNLGELHVPDRANILKALRQVHGADSLAQFQCAREVLEGYQGMVAGLVELVSSFDESRFAIAHVPANRHDRMSVDAKRTSCMNEDGYMRMDSLVLMGVMVYNRNIDALVKNLDTAKKNLRDVTGSPAANESAQITDFAWNLIRKKMDEMTEASEFATWRFHPASDEEQLSGWVDSSVDTRYAVDIKARTCTCQQRKVHAFACKHHLKVLYDLNLLDNHEYMVDPRYMKKMHVQCLEDAKANAGMHIKGMKAITKHRLSDGGLIEPAAEPKQKQKKRKLGGSDKHGAHD